MRGDCRRIAEIRMNCGVSTRRRPQTRLTQGVKGWHGACKHAGKMFATLPPRRIPLLAALVSALVVVASCGGVDDDTRPNEPNVSTNNSKRSHNAGQYCISCHRNGGDGKGWFTVAGTVYQSNEIDVAPNGIIELRTQPMGGGELLHEIEVDALGNFYTTEEIDFEPGLFPVAISAGGRTRFKSLETYEGECSSCHGVTEPRLVVD